MTVFIKNMVCVRCKMAVQTVLESLNIDYVLIQLGKAHLKTNLTGEEQKKLNHALKHYHLELMEDTKKILTEQIKILIIELLQRGPGENHEKLSVYLSKNLHYDYTYLANTFSETEGRTIERFYIENRVERVKELLVYETLNITEIAYKMNFSSVAHLCLQFKKVTGNTPSMFKKLCESESFVWRTCE